MFIIDKILGVLVGSILYPLLINAPLAILNGIYQAFLICSGASIGQMFFNQSQGKLIIDTQAPIFAFILRTLIICLILIVIMIIVLAVEHLVTKKKINFLSKIKWPIIAITSTVTIPLAFMLLSSLSVGFMSLVGGTSTQVYLLKANINDIYTQMTTGLSKLASNFNITLTDVGSKEFDVKILDAITKLREAVVVISQEAAKSGLQDMVKKCSDTLTYLENMQNILISWDTLIITPFNDVMNYLNDSSHWSGDHIVQNQTITDKVNNIIVNLGNVQFYWNESISGIQDVLKNAQIFCKSSLTQEIEIITDHKMTVESLLSTVKSNWDLVQTPWANFNNLWINKNDSNLSLYSCILDGGTWKNLTGSEQMVFDTKDHQTSLNTLCTCIDPQTNNTYNLVIRIYQLVTGHTDTNWARTYFRSWKEVSLAKVGIGFIIIAGSCFVTGLFGLMAARRLIELAILAISSIVFAVIGIRDDGAKYTNAVKLVIAKMFSIIIAYGAFVIGSALLQTVSTWITTHAGTLNERSFAMGIVQALVLVGGLLGAYHIAILLQQWMGDSTSIQGTMADLGAMNIMGSAAKTFGVAVAGAKMVAKGGIKAAATHRGNTNAKKWKMAEAKGFGQVQYDFDKHGKAKVVGFKMFGSDDPKKNLETARNFELLMKDKKVFKDYKKQIKQEKKIQKQILKNGNLNIPTTTID